MINHLTAPHSRACNQLQYSRYTDKFALKSLLRNKPTLRQSHCASRHESEGYGDAVYMADVSPTDGDGRTPLILGLISYVQRHLTAGYFAPIGRAPVPTSELKADRIVELIRSTCEINDGPKDMTGISEDLAHKLIREGHTSELIDIIYSAFAKYKKHKQITIVSGPGVFMGDTELDAQLASALSTPVILTMNGTHNMTASDCFNHVMMKRQVFLDKKVDVLGVALNRLPKGEHAILTRQLKEKFTNSGVQFAGALPEDNVLANLRLDEIAAHLGASIMFGERSVFDKDCTDIIIGSQRIEELLETLDAHQGSPLIVTSMDRLDIVLGLLAAQLSVKGPTVTGVLLTRAGSDMGDRRYARDTVSRIFEGLEGGSLYKGTLLPVLHVDKPMFEVLKDLQKTKTSILASSSRKIRQCRTLFDRYIDANALVASIERHKLEEGATDRITPQLFQYKTKAACLKAPQHIVLPESEDKRVLEAAAEVTQRGLAKITLLGSPDVIRAEAKKLGVDISLCKIVNPLDSDKFDVYVDALVEARKKKGIPRDVAVDTVRGDVSMFGVLMVHCGDADGMVSGACHTTAATVRPAMQVLKNEKLRVSSVFFMCLPDKVLVYGDCAVNTNPTSEELAQIAVVSAETAKAFGVEPKVAMLSYSTMGSGEGPDVKKVTEAVEMAKKMRPNLKLEGPMQYDAAIDPKVAAVKVKGQSDVAGKATVFIFPDLNTGNIAYKAVQQSTGAIAMGPIMQGLNKPVNDLSRGCTVPDIINTICVTSVQAMQNKGLGTVDYSSLDEAEEPLLDTVLDLGLVGSRLDKSLPSNAGPVVVIQN